MPKDKYIEIKGARANNLKNIDVKIPQGKFVAIRVSRDRENHRWLLIPYMLRASAAMWSRSLRTHASFWDV